MVEFMLCNVNNLVSLFLQEQNPFEVVSGYQFWNLGM